MATTTIAAALFFGACTVGFASLQSLVVERARVHRNLRRLRTVDLAPGDVRRKELARPFVSRIVFPALRGLGRAVRPITPSGVAERLAQDLAYAGSPAGWDAERVLALKWVGAGAGACLPLLAMPATHVLSPLRAVVLAGMLGVVGYYLPEWMLRSRAGRRQAAIQRALPDALDLLSITVEAGLGFDAAVSRVAKQAGGPLGEELHRVLQEMQIGKTRSEALRSLAERTSVAELHSFVLATIQADTFGISIAGVLHVQAKEMRTKRRQRAEERAQKIPVKIVVLLLACIFPSLFVVILGPAGITIYHNLLHR